MNHKMPWRAMKSHEESSRILTNCQGCQGEVGKKGENVLSGVGTGVGIGIFDTIGDGALNEGHVLLQNMCGPRVQELVEKLAHGASDVLWLGSHVWGQQRHQPGAVGVGNNKPDRNCSRSRHDLKYTNRWAYQWLCLSHLQRPVYLHSTTHSAAESIQLSNCSRVISNHYWWLSMHIAQLSFISRQLPLLPIWTSDRTINHIVFICSLAC